LVERYGDPDAVIASTADESNVDYGAIVEDVYLRTLSRFPNDAEKERSLLFITEGDDKVKAFRGLVWALINTKEFIVNH
jgi:hypothetical protein